MSYSRTAPSEVRICAAASCPRPSQYRFCSSCYFARVNRVIASHGERISLVEAEIREMVAIEQVATGFLGQVLMPLITSEQEAKSAGDAKTAKQLRRRINLKINTFVKAKKESDEHVRDLKADVEALRRLGLDLVELSKRQNMGISPEMSSSQVRI